MASTSRQKPDHAEFLRLFLSTEGETRAFIRTLLRDPRDVDDVCQSVAVVLWEKFALFDPERSFGAWSRGVAVREVLAMRKKNGRCPTPFSPDVIAAIKDEFEKTLSPHSFSSQKVEALDHCVRALPGASKEMLDLRYREGLPLQEIANRVGRTIAATQRALSRVHARLIDCVKSRMSVVKGGDR